MKSILLLLFAALLATAPALAQTATDVWIEGRMTSQNISGLSACIIKKGKLVWAKGYGLADRSNLTPVTPNTVFMLASVSKTVTATALMHLYERGYFQLDDAINNHLPFQVQVPNHPAASLTFRQLFTHTSAIRDNWGMMIPYYVTGNSPIALGQYLQDYLVPGGQHYSAANNFYTYTPGSQHNYSNIAVALMGYLVETISNRPFDEYCNDSIFTPLCMDRTSWLLSGLDPSEIARPYQFSNGFFLDQGLYGYPDYPNGQLRTTSISLAKFLHANIMYGRFGNHQLIDSATTALMHTVQNPAIHPNQGLTWFRLQLSDRQVWGHSGGDAGVSTQMYLSKSDSTGVIVLTNSNADVLQIAARLFRVADTISMAGAPDIACAVVLGETTLALPEKQHFSLKAYPIPNNGMFMVRLADVRKEDDAVTLQAYNMLGQLVATQQLAGSAAPQQVALSVPAGVYLIKVAHGAYVATERIIVE